MSVPNIYSILTSDSGVNAIVGNNVFNTTAEENTAAPYIVWKIITAPPETSLDGDQIVSNYRIQIDMYTKTPDDKYNLLGLVIVALKDYGYSLGVTVDDYEDATDLYRLSIDFSIWS